MAGISLMNADEAVSTEPECLTDEKCVISTKEAKEDVGSSTDAPYADIVSHSVSAKKEDDVYCEIKVDETEEDFKTPEEGDGEENPEEGGGEDVTDEVKLDDDQDIESPAYIPKTGKYYMHDSREDTEAPREEKKSRADGMWSRDRYNERYQQPRSRRQMIDKYGYDIRLGETKEMAEDKERNMRESGTELDEEKRNNPRGDYSKESDGRIDKLRSNRKAGGRDDDGKARDRNGDVNEQDDIRPAARRNERNEMGSFTGGEQLVQKGRGGSSRQFNRTFNNSKRNSGRDDYKEKEVPKRYSTQRSEKSIPTSVNNNPTDIVYFDPTKQVPRENRSLMREKKPLDIVPPPT